MFPWDASTARKRSRDLLSAWKKSIVPKSIQPSVDPFTLPLYKYKPLDHNEFRLLVLLKGSKDEPVHVELEHENVLHAQGYAALSYVWGDRRDENNYVVVNEKSKLQITYNLWQALRRIRAEYEDRVLFVDAICIDQKDRKEKTQQVQYMSRIYPQASRVLCWLGDDDGTVKEAFTIMKSWRSVYSDDRARSVLVKEIRQLLAREHSTWQHPLERFFSRSYFRRAWCLPEVCTDINRRPNVLCGEHEISWTTLYLGFYALIRGLYEEEVARVIGPYVVHVLPMLNVSWRVPETMLLSHLITQMARREATIAQDKIFAILGLVERSGSEYPKPDYNWSMEQVCIIYTRAIIENEQHLNLLRAVSTCRDKANFPSWCIRPDLWVPRTGNLEILNDKFFKKHNATRSMMPLLEPAADVLDSELRISGYSFDRVAAVHDLEKLVKNLFREPRTWADILNRSQNFCYETDLTGRYEATDECMVRAFLTTLSNGNFWVDSKDNETDWYHRDQMYEAYREHMSGMSALDDLSMDASSNVFEKDQLLDYLAEYFNFDQAPTDWMPAKSNPIIPHTFLEDRVIEELLYIIEQLPLSRKFIATRKGYIGFVSEECLEADEVCLLPGSAVPLVLRERGQNSRDGKIHLFAGDAYVHGIMQGELLEFDQDTHPPPEVEQNITGLKLFCIT